MSNFTPGPWFVEPNTNVVMSGNEDHHRRAAIAQCSMSHGLGTAGIEDAANARLIAAAPELYEALRRIASSEDAPGNGDRRDEYQQWALNVARAALAKVRP